MKYKKKPVIIDAIEFIDSTKCFEKLQELGLDPLRIDYNVNPPQIIIDTLEGEHRGNIGDFIIKGIKGEFYPCKPDIFQGSYDLAE